MWTRHKNHLVWTDPWVYVALPDQEIEYFQIQSGPETAPKRFAFGVLYRLLKSLAIL